MITQHAWMFLSSFEKLREKMMLTETISMAHLGARAFEEIGGEVVQTTAFVRCANHVEGYKGTYCRLIEPTSQQGKEEMFLAGQKRYTANQDDFAKIPGASVAYWVSKKLYSTFRNSLLYDYTISDGQNKTGDNAKFVREFWEVRNSNVGKGKSGCSMPRVVDIVSGMEICQKLLIGQRKRVNFIRMIRFVGLFQNIFGIKLELHGV